MSEDVTTRILNLGDLQLAEIITLRDLAGGDALNDRPYGASMFGNFMPDPVDDGNRDEE